MQSRLARGVGVGSALAGAALLGAAYYYFRERQTEEPDYRVLATDGDFQLRSYPQMVVAETVTHGPRREALERGFRILADYIFAKSREDAPLAMTVPVLQDPGNPMADQPPTFDDALLDGGWRTRFVMPTGHRPGDLPEPPDGVELVTLPERRVGVVSFAGRPSDSDLAGEEDRLRGWLFGRGETAATEPEYAFYNSPVIPGPLRRNELWLEIR